ncbi:uncharacterized protein yc1106_02861 [Curvularia clavata]|uniref:Uncharacterized protein n=1 Tax=Curvularia clavata TaxID=95742 RepID=A0A9Q8Z4K0_CURCL|nr:uncharacterized protein yc1106_02861 [Curvularia clavata]
MTTSHGLEDIFGYMPFDHFLVEKWDPESILNQQEQEKSLVKTWISLGRHGRSAYIQRCMEEGQIPVPDHIPKDLSAFEKRKTVDPDEWSSASAIWIRTWYGNEADERDSPKKETVTRASSDAAYDRLWQKALWPLDKHGFDDSMFGPYVFDNDAAAYGVSARDADDEVELMDEIPSFILSALIRCPDAMEGSNGRDVEEDEELTWSQALLVVVADREACEDGWVLLIALNHQGQVLHKRVRCKASDVGQNTAFWRDGGEPLDIENLRENVMDYLDSNRSGNGWDDG